MKGTYITSHSRYNPPKQELLAHFPDGETEVEGPHRGDLGLVGISGGREMLYRTPSL